MINFIKSLFGKKKVPEQEERAEAKEEPVKIPTYVPAAEEEQGHSCGSGGCGCGSGGCQH